ncbi:TonB-dependent vitamin B12 receptor [Pseudoxanthomonas mexicana]|uniref:TonB-dependent vitamin B12 receptor n=1 Tax=Pseudoxanthomonas mexicana TaxID=128785 RepID=UPI00398AD53D
MHESIPALRPLSLAVLLALPAAAAAQSSSTTELDEIVVTGTRTEVALRDSLVPAQVIGREEIERSQARSLVELLKGRAGVNVVNQGGMGKLTTINLRGAESDHVLVLVDGVRIGSTSAALAAFQDLPVDLIDRIEIVRGPRSSLYGSEAIGGVIQIFTRRDDGKLRPHLRVGAGSHNLREASAGLGGGGERGWFGADVSYQRTDGINACRGSGTLFQGCFADEPDRDGYRNRSASLRGGVNLGDTVKLEGSALHASAFNEYDGSVFGGNEADNIQQVAGGKLTWTPGDRVTVTAQAGRAYDKSDNYFTDHVAPRSHVSRFNTRRDNASLQADLLAAEGHLLTFGVDWIDDRLDSSTAYTVADRENLALFAEYQGRVGAHRFQASLRNDDNEQFGNHSTGSLGWGYDFGDALRFNLSYATGFRAPSFNELYFPFSGNPNLGPEESRSLNAGLIYDAGHGRWTLNAYQTDIDDMIGYDSSFNLVQAEEARIRGAELTFDTTLAGWDLSTQISHADPRNRSAGANYDHLLPRRVRNSARIDADRAFGDFRLGLTAHGAGSRHDNAANTLRVAGYGTLDLRAEYAFHRDWSLQARVGNVFDRQYETIAWYNQPGREYGLSLRYQPRP